MGAGEWELALVESDDLLAGLRDGFLEDDPLLDGLVEERIVEPGVLDVCQLQRYAHHDTIGLVGLALQRIGKELGRFHS